MSFKFDFEDMQLESTDYELGTLPLMNHAVLKEMSGPDLVRGRGNADHIPQIASQQGAQHNSLGLRP